MFSFIIYALIVIALFAVLVWASDSFRNAVSATLKPIGLDDEFDAITAGLNKTIAKLNKHEADLERRKELLANEAAELDAKATAAILKHEDTDAQISKVQRVKQNIADLVR